MLGGLGADHHAGGRGGGRRGQTLLDRGAWERDIGTETLFLKIGQVIELSKCPSCPRDVGL